MKIRNSFVSNSSSSSFTLLGWELEEKNGDIWDQAEKLEEKLEIPEEYELYILEHYGPDDCFYWGLGTSDEEMDHYMEDWEDFRSEPAPKEVEQWLIKRAKELGLEAPMSISYTWFNG